MAEKTKSRVNQGDGTDNTNVVIDPPSPIARHLKWKKARTNKFGQMTSAAAQEITDKIVSSIYVTLQNCNYYGPRGSGSNSSSATMTTDKLVEIIGSIKQELRKESTPFRPSIPDVLDARVSTKESCAEAAANVVAKERSTLDASIVRLYIVCGNSTQVVALGKMYRVGGIIHNVAYADDVVRVCVETIYDGDASVPFPTAEIQYVRDTSSTFIAWPKHLVKPIADDSNHNVHLPLRRLGEAEVAAEADPLGELMKTLFCVYKNPVEVSWEATQFGLPNVGAKFFITHADLAEIISGDKCLNISILQLWTMAHWQLFVLCPRENMIVWFCSLRKKPDINIKAAINSTMKTITSSSEGMSNQAAPRWVEPKSHVQTGGYECGYYVMHWMWCIVTGGLKDDWNKWFSDGSPLDVEAITTLRQKWATFFLSIRKSRC
ncbi:hypothetical protein GmHk_09G025764 [Glycine max]|nr:hypothetical protein GmHk_09G025764 [Glycine max]